MFGEILDYTLIVTSLVAFVAVAAVLFGIAANIIDIAQGKRR